MLSPLLCEPCKLSPPFNHSRQLTLSTYSDSSPDACPAINTATVYITIASDATVVEVAKIETIPSTPDQPLTNLVEASEASTLPAMSPTGKALSLIIFLAFTTVSYVEAN